MGVLLTQKALSHQKWKE